MSGLKSIAIGQPWLIGSVEEGNKYSIAEYGPLREKLFLVDGETAAHLHERGIVCPDSYANTEVRLALDKVDSLISKAPELHQRIALCVKQIVVLRAPADEYDVSHSEPQWPGRIYTSIPARSPIQDLRISEAIVHEAMHLNLTLFEQVADVFRLPDQLLYSPWRDRDRPASGVFHGLYVFRCVERFFNMYILPSETDPERVHFLSRRVAQISLDISQVDVDGLRHCTGRDGAELLNQLAI